MTDGVAMALWVIYLFVVVNLQGLLVRPFSASEAGADLGGVLDGEGRVKAEGRDRSLQPLPMGRCPTVQVFPPLKL